MALAIALPALLLVSCAPPADDRRTGRSAPADIPLARDGDVVEARVPRNATLETLLRSHAVSTELSSSLVQAVAGVFNPRNLRANQPYQLVRTLDGVFREFRYEIDANRVLRVASRPADEGTPGFHVEVLPIPKDLVPTARAVEITRERPSLIGAFEAIGENVQLALQLAEILGGEVDFNADLQPGDRLDVLFERALREGEFVGYGDVRAVVLVNEGRRIAGFRFVGPDGQPGWYDDEGRSLKRQFLRSPLAFEPRITSGFSYRRLHPVHGAYRAHPGIDYGAPYGSRVVAVGSGLVLSAGWAGEAGRMVRIRHAGGYETMYLHLSSFAPGIRAGARVAQGDFIGRVGSSGTATGAHLDYRIRKNGSYVNPLVELGRMPKGDPIPAESLDVFAAERDRALAELTARLNAGPAATPSRTARN
jgi:murein DD-endopeptidase MepM/ murein hydrolase activator NlpD